MRQVSFVDYLQYFVGSEDTLHDCLMKFEHNRVHTLLVENQDKIVGTITDGDIRKALLKARTLHTRVKLVMNVDYVFGMSESECEDLFVIHNHILLIPMVNLQREVKALYLRY